MELAERLIVAIDPPRGGERDTSSIMHNAREVIKSLAGTGVTIKVNSILRLYGYRLIKELHDAGFRVFADLKLVDIPNTMGSDGDLISAYKPEILTVMGNAGLEGMRSVQEALPDTDVLAVTVLTSLNKDSCNAIFGCSPDDGVVRFARIAVQAGVRGLILSPKELSLVRNMSEFDVLQLNTPGIRPQWFLTDEDDQSRVMTPKDAIASGADRIVVGRPILQAENPVDAVHFTLEEIQEGLEAR